jgi:predicted nucleic acid-binding protein
MEPAFWDSSAIVPLCVRQTSTTATQALGESYRMAVSWFAPVEVRGAIARLVRMGLATSNDQVQGLALLDIYRTDWHEVVLGPGVRQKAEDFVERFPLRAADALQLGAAWAWCQGHPRGRPFISGDAQLLDAARQLGFTAIRP